MSRASRHRILAAMLSACLLSLLGGCTPLTVLAVLGGCKDGGSNGSSGGVTGSVTTGEVRDGMTIAQTKAWFNGSDGPDNVCQAYPDGQCTWWACMRGHKNGLDVGSYWGNGGDWAASATAAGWKTTRTDPVAGSIVSYPPAWPTRTPVRPRRRRRGGRPDGRHRDHQRDERARRPGHRQPPHAQDQRRRGLHPAQRQCVHQWFRRHGFHVIRFRIVRFVVIVRLVLLFGSGGGGMDVLQFRLGLHGRGGGLRRDGTHATPEQARAIARKMIASYKDWGDGDYDALVWLWNKESGWQWNATNPSSGAYGIPQALPASKLASAGDDWKDNAATQIRWGLNYIAGRYGSPSAAKTFWLAHNWY